jgi:uncharacterized phage-like protein YoqJ
MTATFTGHRPNKLGGYKPEDNKELLWRLHDAVVEHIEKYKVDTWITGMALGVDQWGAKIVLKLRETTHPNLKLICAIPCKNHEKNWNKQSQKEWQDIVDKADQVIYTSEDDYAPYLMMKRNEWMCNHSQYILAVWDGTDGGTGNCVKYAEKQDKNIYIIRP